jgi:hypothetical protein
MKRLIIILTGLLLIIIPCLYLLRPVTDPDLFWHISTGRWILENKALPQEDPFSYTTPKLLSDRELFILRSYWLSQVLYWLNYRIMGFSGIVLLRFFLAFSLIFLIYKRTKRIVNERLLILSLLFVFSINLLSVYPMDRPQVWSFLFFALLLFILETGRYFLLPPLMLLWSNMHGGYILGTVFIGIYLFEGLLRFFKNEGSEKGLFIWGCLGIIAGFINPCTYLAFLETIKMPSSMKIHTIEYMSTVATFLKRGDMTMPFYWAFLLMAIIKTCINLLKKKAGLRDIIALTGLGYFSFTQIRYIVFFFIWSLPVVASFLNSLRKWLRFTILSLLVLESILLTIMLQEYNNIKNIKNFTTNRWISGYYPEAGVRFIKANNIQGKMYNFHDWGGYLIWSFYPEKRTFIDGRQLYEYLFMQSMSIDQAVREPVIMGMPFWKAILKTYDINFILIPAFDMLGNVSGLLGALINDNEWIPVFFRGNSIIFVRNTKENYPVIYKYGIPRDYILDDLIGQVEGMLKKAPRHISLYIALGDLNVKAKRYEKALEVYQKGLEVQPFNSILKKRIKDLKLLMKHM